MLPWTEYSSFAVSLLAILAPFAAVPVFLSLTNKCAPAECSQVASSATLTAAIALVIAAFLGRPILAVLGISIDALRVSGGLVLLLMAFSTLGAQGAVPQRVARRLSNVATDRSHGAIVPLGLPLLAGPASISAVIAMMDQGAGFRHDALVVGCILLICGTIWVLLYLARPLGRRLGSGTLTVVSRLSGLVTAAIAVELITNGLRALFPVLGSSGPM